jgi:predicted Fe-Mo cluster-binding NifX family protein
MKIAIPVKDEALTFFGNAGHTPSFAIFELHGAGMFRSFKLEEIRNNPRTDLEDHEEEDEHHSCSHGSDDAEHVAQHFKMGEVLEDCDYLVVKRACKNTANAMKNYGVKIVKYDGTSPKSDAILRELSAKFI